MDVGIDSQVGFDPKVEQSYFDLDQVSRQIDLYLEDLKKAERPADSWAGEFSESVTTMLMVFGDIVRNHISFYDPPVDFEEELKAKAA